MSVEYAPGAPVRGVSSDDYAYGELLDLAKALREAEPFLFIQTLNVAPDKPREGMIAKADGTHWNPGGSGAGIYGYIGGAWVKLG